MATKKSGKAVKKAPAKTTTTTKKVVRRTPVKRTRKSTMPGGYLMYIFLIIAALAAIVAIAGIVLESQVEPNANMENYEGFFTFIKQCKTAALGIFGVFLVLACFTKMNKN